MLESKFLFDIVDKLGIIQTVKRKLLIQPEPAADELGTVLGEPAKILGFYEATSFCCLRLSFDTKGEA